MKLLAFTYDPRVRDIPSELIPLAKECLTVLMEELKKPQYALVEDIDLVEMGRSVADELIRDYELKSKRSTTEMLVDDYDKGEVLDLMETNADWSPENFDNWFSLEKGTVAAWLKNDPDFAVAWVGLKDKYGVRE